MTANPSLAPAYRVAGHFGELLQGRLGPDGPVALVSLPCPPVWVQIVPEGFAPPETQVRALCWALGLPFPAHVPRVQATMPIGAGAGSSTASLVAVARALGYAGQPEDLARACVQAEGASDPLMFDHAERILFASRQGQVLRRYGPMPRFTVVGGFFGPAIPTDPGDTDFPDIADLVEVWDRDDRLHHKAELAAESARRCLAARGPADDPTQALAVELHAAGIVIAHTGSARGLIFPDDAVPPHARCALAEAGLDGIIQFQGGGA